MGPGSAATATIEQLGGTLEFNQENPDGSVVEVSLDGTATTDADLSHLTAFRELRSLDLSATAITNRGLETIGWLKRLESLMLNATSITGSGLVHLEPLTQLRQVAAGLYRPVPGRHGTSRELPESRRAVAPRLGDHRRRPRGAAGIEEPGGLAGWAAPMISDAGLAALAGLTNRVQTLTAFIDSRHQERGNDAPAKTREPSRP